MWTKRILICLPILISLLLLQSGFWVPTYEEQARLSPDRLSQYISASIGDAQILNPILHADTASGGVCNLVFEGLIDRDKDLNWRARLAERWEITEEAYLVVGPESRYRPIEVVDLLRLAKEKHAGAKDPLAERLRNLVRVGPIQPAEDVTRTAWDRIKVEAEGKEKVQRIKLTVAFKRPARVRLTLKEVDQDLDETVEAVVAKGYCSSFDGSTFLDISAQDKDKEPVEIPAEALAKFKKKYAKEFLPAVEHNPIITFHLRRGVKFHDGHEFDSGDVKFTYDAIMDPKNVSPRTSDYEPVKELRIVDRHTVRIVYKRLFSPAFGTWGMGILPEHLLNDEQMKQEAAERGMPEKEFNLRKSRFNLHPIGCGPYKFAQWESDEFIKMVRFEDYWEGPPLYSARVIRIIPDSITQEMEFYAGAVDGFSARPNQVDRLRQDDRFQNFSGLSYGYSYIGYNMRRELFKDQRVRRALGMAVDVDRIIRYVSYNQAERITGPFVKQTDYYNHAIPPLPYDPEGAVTLLEEAGWTRNSDGILEKDGTPFEFTLITNNGNDIRRDIMAVAQDSWKKIGVQVKTDMLEWSVFISKYIDQGDFDACILGWSMGIEPDLYQIWHSSQTNPRQLNFVGFKNEQADDLIIRIRQEYNHEKQVAMCHRLHAIIAEEQPYTFIAVGRWTALMDKRIVTARLDAQRNIIGYEAIKATKTGSYTYDFNRWIKLPRMPEFLLE